MSDESVSQKLCKRCGKSYPATEEYFKASRHGNLSSPCRNCYREIKAEWRKNNPEKVKQHKKDSHERHRETDNARVKRWVEANPERVRELNRQYRLDHLEERRAYEAQWQRDNPDKVKERNRRWIERHPERARESIKRRAIAYRQSVHGRARRQMMRDLHRDEERAYNRMRYLTVPGERERQLVKAHERRMVEGSFTPSDIRTLYDEQEGRCAYCGITLHGQYHIDHLIPVSRGGTNNPENLRLACPSCNLSKAARLIEEWELVRGW